MKLKLGNIAKIEEAELELNGITVIVGNNNTGKSTIGKTVFSLFNSLFDIENKIERQKQNLIYQVLIRKLQDLSMPNEAYYNAVRISPPAIRMYAEELSLRDTQEGQRQVLTEYLSRFNNDETGREEALNSIIEEVDRINHLSIERLSRSAVSAYFSQIFYSEINSVYQPSKDAVIEAEIVKKKLFISFSDNQCTELRQDIKIMNQAVYLDNPFVLDCLNGSAAGLDEIKRNTVKKLRKNANAMEEIVQLKLIEEKMQEVLQKINEVSSGSLSMDESKSYYYREQGMTSGLNINNLSAGLKSFVIIKTLLENGSLQQKDVLILDEPEIHLHPEWQLKYAEIIILLQKTFELTIILTTHSSHFVEALQFYAKKYNQSEKCTYYLSEKSPFGYKLKAVTDNPTEIYSQLVEASILLDRLKFEMEDTKDE